MACSRPLRNSAAALTASLKKLAVCGSASRNFSHQSTADFPESQRHLQSKIEDAMSVVGGKMVVADMLFTRDGFEYWRNPPIPSSSTVKELACAWANSDSVNSNSVTHFKLCAERSLGKRIEDFLQRMVTDVEQRLATDEGSSPLDGRRLIVQLADEQNSMAVEKEQELVQAFNKRLDVPLDKLETKQGFNDGTDVPLAADEQGLTMMEETSFEARNRSDVEADVEGPPVKDEELLTPAMQGLHTRVEIQPIMVKEQQNVERAQNVEIGEQHIKERKTKGEDRHELIVDKQIAIGEEKKGDTSHQIWENQGMETGTVEPRGQDYGVVKEYHPQTDNIVRRRRRIGRKIVYVYYDRGYGRNRASL